LWDPNLGNRIGVRRKWRNKRLLMKNKIHVKSPIRYGRLSGNNEAKQYTMVFSSECEHKKQFGTAYVVPFKNNEIRSLKGIENQARFLSQVEGGNDTKLCKGANDKWCTIGIIYNPEIDKNLKNKISVRWKELLEKDEGLKDFQKYKVDKEKSILSNTGEILINWPKSVDKSYQNKIDEFDIILATCTKPNIRNYPNVNEQSGKILSDKRKYFFRNIENGISTFQDRLVLK
jgi:hypothetical protein